MWLGMDPVYLILAIGLMALSGVASLWVKASYRKYRQVPNQRGLTGAQAVRAMLSREGLGDIAVERIGGELSDHYDPSGRVIRLSQAIHDGRSLAAVSVACHEAGHALQHQQNYAPMKLRTLSVPFANIGGRLGPIIVMIGIMLRQGERLADGSFGPGMGLMVAKIGLVLFACATFFSLITLPVELNASARAKAAMTADGIVVNDQEAAGAANMLRAAAFTYVAAAAASIAWLLYYAWRAGLFGGRRSD